jgi:CRP-like cAMP-binding protein
VRKSLILLGVLNDSDLEWMLRTGVKKLVATGGKPVVARQALDSLFIVLTGSFGVVVGGKERVARLLAGDIVGEMSFLDSRPPSATVVADEDSWILEIPREQVSERLNDDPAFAARFYHAVAMFLSLRLRATSSQLGYGQARLAADEEDDDEIPEDILDKLAIAGHRFAILQERARSVNAG